MTRWSARFGASIGARSSCSISTVSSRSTTPSATPPAARLSQLMESDLRIALEKGQLWVAFQPSVDAISEAITGFEALIRWDHPEHGPVSPAVFIPLAEEIGLIDEIGEWVLQTACQQA